MIECYTIDIIVLIKLAVGHQSRNIPAIGEG